MLGYARLIRATGIDPPHAVRDRTLPVGHPLPTTALLAYGDNGMAELRRLA